MCQSSPSEAPTPSRGTSDTLSIASDRATESSSSFFFSSRRRHTRLQGDWSSDVCSSDLVGSGARVYALDRSLEVLRGIELEFGARVVTVYSSRDAVEQHVLSADLVIGAVLVAGAAAPKLVSRQMGKAMKTGSVVVDIAIDQGGCFETSRPTTHADPTYVVVDVVHYCVTNMPGAVPRTSTYALNNATLPFVLALANKGWK